MPKPNKPHIRKGRNSRFGFLWLLESLHFDIDVFLHKLMVHIPTDCGRNSIASVVNPETGLVTPQLSIGKPNGTTEKSFIYSKKELSRVLDDCFGIPFEC